MLAQNIERLEAALLEGFEERAGLVLAAAHHVGHLGSEHEGRTLAVETELLFEVAQKVTEIDVEQMTFLRHLEKKRRENKHKHTATTR